MQCAKSALAARFVRSLDVVLFCLLASSLAAQAPAASSLKPIPPRIDKKILIIPESVVLEEWPHTLKVVHEPPDLKLLNPGQCVRVGISATGDDRDTYLEKSQLSFRVEFAGQTQSHPLAPLAGIKQIGPGGVDVIAQVMAAAHVKDEFPKIHSIGASTDNWCVPADAQDGTAVIDAEVETPGGHEKLARAKIQIESFETGSKRSFKNDEEIEAFLMGYHYQPNPARLFPALQFFAADEKWRSQTGSLETTAATFGAALKVNPAAAKDFMDRLSKQSGFTRAFGLLTLLNSGFDIEPVLNTMSEEDRQKFARHPVIPDPFDLTHVEDIGTRLDMLWSIFMSTGQFAPIQKIASTLAWRPDWEAFDKARESANPPKEWTPAIGRAVGYGAAGWALGSFQRTDPLAADYIDFLIASPDAPDAVRTELKGLLTNPAFKQQGEK
jgi:hypothetical protein